MKNNSKIMLVSEYFPPKIFGGGEISAYQLAKSLAKNGFNVFVLTSSFKGLKRFEEKDGIKIFRTLKTGNNPSSIFENVKRSIFFQRSLKKEIFKIDKKENFDVIHFLNTTSIPDFKINKKTVATINGYTNFCPKRNLFYKEKEVCTGCNPTKFIGCIRKSEYVGKYKLPWFLKHNPIFWFFLYQSYKKNNQNLKNVDKFIAISDFIKKLLLRNNVKNENIETIPNIIDLKESGETFKIKEKGVIITYVGSLEKLKGTNILLDAFNEIKENDATLLIFGDGSQRKQLEKISSKNIKFYGQVGQKYLPSIYKQSDIIVQPALWPEPLSRVMIEALFFGKPIIATNNGGNAEGVIDGQNGYLINNKKEFKEKLKVLINKKELREKMSLESKKLFEEKFSKKIISKIINLYRN